jgi:hypothetical protein
MLSLFTLPAGALASTTAYIGEVSGDIWPYIALAIGLPLAFYFIRKVISMVGGRMR